MKCEVAYEIRSQKLTDGFAFGGWHWWTPQPRNSTEAGEAVKEILDKKDAVLITVKPLTHEKAA